MNKNGRKKNEEQKIEFLLNRYLSGIASDHDIVKLRQLSESFVSLKSDLEEYDKVIDQIESLGLMKQVDTRSAFVKLKERLKHYQVKKGWFYYWQKVAVILLLPLLFISVFQFIHQSKSQLSKELSSLSYNEVHTPPGLRSNLKLPDGTKVWLNGNTRIKYPISFAGDERRVQLEGEAYFEVVKNVDKPFIVDTEILQIKALGTAFNCMAYAEDNFIETTLTEGKVKITKVLKGESKGEYILQSGQVLTFETESNKFFLKKGGVEKHISWRSGKFMFKDDPLEVVCRKLERWFNAEIIIKDESLKDYAFTATFEEEGLEEILQLIRITSPINYTTMKRKMNEKYEYGKLKIIIEKKK